MDLNVNPIWLIFTDWAVDALVIVGSSPETAVLNVLQFHLYKFKANYLFNTVKIMIVLLSAMSLQMLCSTVGNKRKLFKIYYTFEFAQSREFK